MSNIPMRKPFTRTLIHGAVGMALSALAVTPALAEGPKQLDVASTFGTKNYLGQGAMKLAQELEVATGGEVKLRIHEPGDLVPPLEVFNSVSSGAVTAGWDWMGYWAGAIPLSALYGGLPFGPSPEVFMSWVWDGEGLDLIQKAYDPYGVKVLPCMVSLQETGGWYNQRIESPEDFEGLSMRIAGFGAKVLSKLGASTQLVPGNEIYLALERGRVKAAEFSTPRVDIDMGFEEVAEFYYFPGWHQGANWNSLLINKATWDQYSDERKAQFETACRANVQWSMSQQIPSQVAAMEEFEAKGVKILRFPDPVIDALKAAWDEVREEELNNSPELQEAYASLMKHAAVYEKWNSLQSFEATAEAEGDN
ncbi:TRAP transporter substrate-binding protein [Oceanimonas sp. MB9]|uniref:TRAP transporter substrate-binding protein n=1 Tax=Oceanimonas sp. MB9 TaxID=2588453 RepID=UPI00197FC778|nr:TRAP transporter substrate-binding protein [Oceanimonas sp. MB9]NHI02114.1 Monocarboxylate 2-oxoacid-binding periplasmic protein [Oceanimonas sp. MB9]